MVNLHDSCCLDLYLDVPTSSLHYGDGVSSADTHKVPLSNLLPVLLNKSLSYPSIVYEEHLQVFHETDQDIANCGLSFDVITLPPGLLGIEFVKTHVYFTPDNDTSKSSCVIEVEFGVVTVILQKNKQKDPLDFDTKVEDGLVITLEKGDKAVIPVGYFYTFINTGNEPAVYVRVFKKNSVIDYNILKKENGLAYYCIRKNAKAEIVLNPLYKETPKIKKVQPAKTLEVFGLSTTEKLYTQLRYNRSIFEENLWG